MARQSFPMYFNRPWGEKFGDAPSTPLNLTSLDVGVVVNGNFPTTAIVTSTLTFLNTHDKVLEGALEFTLPENAVVCAYGVDLDGTIVDAVVVEKEKAKLAFEESVRTGKSAAISEMVKGNVFSNKIYPIEPGKTRQVKVSYQIEPASSDKGDLIYEFPVRFNTNLTSLKVQVECAKSDGLKCPEIENKFKADKPSDEMKFSDISDRWIASAEWPKGAKPNPEDSEAYSLRFVVPSVGSKPLHALELDEKYEGKKKAAYFAISCLPQTHGAIEGSESDVKDERTIKHLVVYWDSSLSRDAEGSESKAREKEINLLKAIVESLGAKSESLTVSIIPFRESLDEAKVFEYKAGESASTCWTSIEKFMNSIVYDGGTNFSILKFNKNLRHDKRPVDCFLLFTDGMNTIGSELHSSATEASIFTANASEKSNISFLRLLAEASGGQFIDPRNFKSEKILSTLVQAPFQYIGMTIEKGQNSIDEVYPSKSVTISSDKGGRFTLVGRAYGDITFTLNYGRNRVITHKHSFTLKIDSACKPTGIIARLWAKQKIDDLSALPEKNKNEIAELGKLYGIVTSDSSFVVLEKAEEYLKHNVAPPKTRLKVWEEYMNTIKKKETTENERIEIQLKKVQGLWAKRKEWYNKDFTSEWTKQKKKPGEAFPDGTWDCVTCTFINAANTWTCTMCNAPSTRQRPTPTVPNVSQSDRLSRATDSLERVSFRAEGIAPGRGRGASRGGVGARGSASGGGGGPGSSRSPTKSSSISSVIGGLFRRSGSSSPAAPTSHSTSTVSDAMEDLEGESDGESAGGDSFFTSESAMNEETNSTLSMPVQSSPRGSSSLPLSRPKPTSAPMSPPPPPASQGPQSPTLALSGKINQPQSLSKLQEAKEAPRKRVEPEKREKSKKESTKQKESEEERGDKRRDRVTSSRRRSASEEMKLDEPASDGTPQMAASITVQKWNPDTPYIKKMEKEKAIDAAYSVYLAERKSYKTSPSFYFDVANHLFARVEGKKENDLVAAPAAKLGLRVLTSVVELELESPQLLRIVGYKLAELNLLEMAASVFEKVLALRPDEPQSHRDLGLVLFESQTNFDKCISLLYKVVMGKWDNRFDEIELSALIELNSLLTSPWGKQHYDHFAKTRSDNGLTPIPHPSLILSMPVELRIVMGWDTADTDVDLHVIEPNGEECYFSNNRTRIGGCLSRDFRHGYGPEEYSIKKAMPGKYKVKAKYFASHQQSLTGATTLLLYIYKFYGTALQHKEVVTLRLAANKDIIEVCDAEFAVKKTELKALEPSDPIGFLVEILVKGTEFEKDPSPIVYKFTRSEIGARSIRDVRSFTKSDVTELGLPETLLTRLNAFLFPSS